MTSVFAVTGVIQSKTNCNQLYSNEDYTRKYELFIVFVK